MQVCKLSPSQSQHTWLIGTWHIPPYQEEPNLFKQSPAFLRRPLRPPLMTRYLQLCYVASCYACICTPSNLLMLYAAGRPTPPRQCINPLFMWQQVVSPYTRTLVTHIFKACQAQCAIVFFVFCHVLNGHQCSLTSPPPIWVSNKNRKRTRERDVSANPRRHTRSRRYLIRDQNWKTGLWE